MGLQYVFTSFLYYFRFENSCTDQRKEAETERSKGIDFNKISIELIEVFEGHGIELLREAHSVKTQR